MTEKLKRRDFLDLSWKVVATLALSQVFESQTTAESIRSGCLGLSEVRLDRAEQSLSFSSAARLARAAEKYYQALAPLPEAEQTVEQQADFWFKYWRRYFADQGWFLPERIPIEIRYYQAQFSGLSHRCRPPIVLGVPVGPTCRSTVEFFPTLIAHELSHLWQVNQCSSQNIEAIETAAVLNSWSIQADSILSENSPARKLQLQRSLWHELSARGYDAAAMAWLREERPEKELLALTRQSRIIDQTWLQQYLAFADQLDKYSTQAAGTEFADFTTRWRSKELDSCLASRYAEKPWFKIIDACQNGKTSISGLIPTKTIDVATLINLID